MEFMLSLVFMLLKVMMLSITIIVFMVLKASLFFLGIHGNLFNYGVHCTQSIHGIQGIHGNFFILDIYNICEHYSYIENHIICCMHGVHSFH